MTAAAVAGLLLAASRGDPPATLQPPTTPAGGAAAAAGQAVPPRVDAPVREESVEDLIRQIRRKHFGGMRKPEIRAQGCEKLRTFTSPSSLEIMYRELRSEKEDVITAMLNHFADCGDGGQAALAWVAIHDDLVALRRASAERITRPESSGARFPIRDALQSGDNLMVNRAGSLAGAIGAIDLIPSLIAAQSVDRPRTDTQGDLAWIAIQQQKSYVSNLVPVVGDNAGAFQPIVSVIGEGSLLRIMDAVVIIYRTEVHQALVRLTSADSGESTERFGYNQREWQEWYVNVYQPLLAQRAQEKLRIERAKQIERDANLDADD